MPVSANTLFHFTDHLDHIVNILEKNFRPNFVLEHLGFLDGLEKDPYRRFYIPMVCFCDLPLSQVANHLKTYGGDGVGKGKYGIGMKKEWGKRKGVSPLLYTYTNARTWNAIRTAIIVLRQFNQGTIIEDPDQRSQSQDDLGDDEVISAAHEILFSHVKPYEGEFEHRGSICQHYRFYDEREWRYVPNASDIGGGLIIKHTEDNRDKEKISRIAKNVSENYPLEFAPNDIKYIIVDNENEIVPMIEKIGIIKREYSEKERMLLSSRVISADQIKDDF